jgi:hypothetical protein
MTFSFSHLIFIVLKIVYGCVDAITPYWDEIDDEDESVLASSTNSNNVVKTINQSLSRDHYSTGSIRSDKRSN